MGLFKNKLRLSLVLIVIALVIPSLDFIGDQDTSATISIFSFLFGLILLFLHFRKKKSPAKEKQQSLTKDQGSFNIDLDKTGRGFICLDCNNSKLFTGTSELYRLYYKNSLDQMDFDDEIVCPYEMTCEECSSSKIGIEVKKGQIIRDHRLSGGGLCIIGSRNLVDFNSQAIEAQLFLAMGGQEDWFEDGKVKFFNRLEEFDGEEDSFISSKFVIEEIISKGHIRQDEYGLGDEDSTYKSKRVARF